MCKGNITEEVLNQLGSATWPMAYLLTFITYNRLTATDCTVFKDFFKFLSWTQLNERAVLVATHLNFVPLSIPFRTYFVLSVHLFPDLFFCLLSLSSLEQSLMYCIMSLATLFLSSIPITLWDRERLWSYSPLGVTPIYEETSRLNSIILIAQKELQMWRTVSSKIIIQKV